MIVTHRLSMNFDGMDTIPWAEVMQNDCNSRLLAISLTEQGQAWPLPEDVQVLLRYVKPDGTGGEYDLLPDGTLAWQAEGNLVTVALAPQLCTVAGVVYCTLVLLQGTSELKTFVFHLLVQPDPAAMQTESEDYYRIQGYLPQPVQASVGQCIVVSAVDEAGRVTATQATDLEVFANAEEVAF